MSTPAESLANIYRQTVLEHSREPHNLRRLAQPDHQATGNNPLCGDALTLYLREDAGVITDAAFEGHGCAISMASASMLTDIVRGRTTAEVHRLVQAVVDALSSRDGSLPGNMTALGGVRTYPSRVRCATLAWRTLDAALGDVRVPVSTE